jgi:hypothetical protein
MTALERAINGETVEIPYDDLMSLFVSETELQAWCDAFGLKFLYVSISKAYKISKK